MTAEPVESVLLVSDISGDALSTLFLPAGLHIQLVADGEAIPGSHWGDSEAGLIADRLYLRADTPVHSALHEAGHWLLMDDARRATLHTDAGGTSDEENAVCYLQVLLADDLPAMGRGRMFRDMDAWGYSFRLGSSRAWFEDDAADALEALLRRRERIVKLDVAQRLPAPS